MIYLLLVAFCVKSGLAPLALWAFITFFAYVVAALYIRPESKLNKKRKESGLCPLPRHFLYESVGKVIHGLSVASFAWYMNSPEFILLGLILPFVKVPTLLMVSTLAVLALGGSNLVVIFVAIICYLIGISLMKLITKPSAKEDSRERLLQDFVGEIWPHSSKEKMPRIKLLERSQKKDTQQKSLTAFAWMRKGADVISVSHDLHDHLDDKQIRAVVAHEVKHTRQWWMEINNVLAVTGWLLLLLSSWYFFGALLLVLAWLGAWYAEIDADNYGCKISGGDVYAQALQKMADHWDYQGGHLLGDPHPPLDKRIARAYAYSKKSESVKIG